MTTPTVEDVEKLKRSLEHEKDRRRKARADLARLKDIIESVRDELDDALERS